MASQRSHFGIHVVVEHPSDASAFFSVFQKKIRIAVGFHLGVEIVAMGFQRISRGTVPVDRILIETVVRREIKAPAKPPHRLCPCPGYKQTRFMCEVGT